MGKVFVLKLFFNNLICFKNNFFFNFKCKKSIKFIGDKSVEEL